MFLETGQGVLPKEKLVSLFESTFPLELPNNGRKPSKRHCERVIASAAILCAIATSSFSNEKNHVAEIEAWVLYISYVLALAERWELSDTIYKDEFEIATQSIYNSLANLCDEMKEREYLIEGNSLADSYIYRVRVTWLLGLMSIYALWRGSKGEPKDEVDDFLREFCKEKRSQLNLWGEAAIPQFLAFFWYFRKINATSEQDGLLRLSDFINMQTKPAARRNISCESLLRSRGHPSSHSFSHPRPRRKEPLIDTFTGKSYALEGLVHLFVRRNWKQANNEILLA